LLGISDVVEVKIEVPKAPPGGKMSEKETTRTVTPIPNGKTIRSIVVHNASKPGKGVKCGVCGDTVDEVTAVGVEGSGEFFCDTCYTVLTNRILTRFQQLREMGRIPPGLLKKQKAS